jgi:hypothetical protein
MVALVSTVGSSNGSCVVSGKKKERKRRRGGWLGQNSGLHEHLNWAATLRK